MVVQRYCGQYFSETMDSASCASFVPDRTCRAAPCARARAGTRSLTRLDFLELSRSVRDTERCGVKISRNRLFGALASSSSFVPKSRPPSVRSSAN
ncbi:hypothetical protein EVAR_50715_1 [Eumeta japonica]|uniref:Uncharacterized protein n=1 Tax=Eumeta variegata TaxID=151549 RepID=A0A4C1YQV0_EUMVA|nr:hypothetical protein EVAR_50715_1 [Eumeta japonica]